MKQEVRVVKSTQTAIPEINQAEKVMYYLIIGEHPNHLIINIGEKTYNSITKMNGEDTATLTIEEPLPLKAPTPTKPEKTK